MLATAALPATATAGDEMKLMRAAAQKFPLVSTIRVRDALEAVEALVAKLAEAIRAASSVALATSVLTLAGALAANRSSRIADAVILKVLGATRKKLMLMYLIEYATLGAATATFGVAAGTLAAYIVVVKVMNFDFQFDPARSARRGACWAYPDRRARHGELLAHSWAKAGRGSQIFVITLC